jgi:hypothetical protein
MKTSTGIHGIMIEFKEPEEVVQAAHRAYDAGYRRMDGYTPIPVEGLAEALGRKPSRVPLLVLIGALCGGVGGYAMQWYAMALDYPINIGGRPLNSWPAFVPITFELTVLAAAITAIVSMLILNRLPEPHHPVFNAPGFDRASTDRFFLCIESRDPLFDAAGTRKFLESLKPEAIAEVPV